MNCASDTVPDIIDAVSISKEHRWGKRSLPIRVDEDIQGVAHADKPFYYRKGSAVSIFNVSIPYERHYVNCVETDIPNINRGDSFVNAYYREGCEHTVDYMLKEKTAGCLQCIVDIICGGELDCDDYVIC